ncbi:MAG: 30S ribosomal protein S2 [Proteobacteria bacterium]|nr:30S ribosomal protein S2 [Pseudomonadota bacterium]
MPTISMKDMLEAGVHFGHQTNHWNPKMKPYVYGARNGIYIVDLQQTVERARQACEFIKSIAAEGKKVIFVGTKKQAREVIEAEAKRANMYYVTERWLGGMLTNFQTVKASIDRLKKIEALKGSESWNDYTKKEQSGFDRELTKLKRGLGGIQEMKKLPGAMFIVDTTKESNAIKEARRLGIPTVAIVDTNCDPTGIDFVIPGNDDALRSVSLFAKMIADACLEGTAQHQERLRAAGDASNKDDDGSEGKKVSRFEGDIDLKGVDAADLEAMEQTETPESTENK